jgi:phosphatidylglycerol---prolipoprotein diacylglyceryl transferase
VHPHLFQFGRLILPTYGFLVALGTVASLLLLLRTARLLSLNTDKIWSVALLAILTALLVSSILLILFRWPRYGPGIGLAQTAIASATALAYARHLGLPIRRTADAFAPCLALGSAVASIGCLEAGCDYGTPARVAWAVIFNDPAAAPGTPLGVPLHPTQLYTGLLQFLLLLFLLWLLRRPHHDGEVFGAWLFLGGLSSSLLTTLRGEGVVATQCIGAVMVIAGALLWLRRQPAVQVSHGG